MINIYRGYTRTPQDYGIDSNGNTFPALVFHNPDADFEYIVLSTDTPRDIKKEIDLRLD